MALLPRSHVQLACLTSWLLEVTLATATRLLLLAACLASTRVSLGAGLPRLPMAGRRLPWSATLPPQYSVAADCIMYGALSYVLGLTARSPGNGRQAGIVGVLMMERRGDVNRSTHIRYETN